MGPEVLTSFEASNRGELRAVTSVVTLLEVLVRPIRRKQQALARGYGQILLGGAVLGVVPPGVEIAKKAAEVRAAYGLSTQGAIHLATAALHAAGVIVTNDALWPSMANLRVLVLTELTAKEP